MIRVRRSREEDGQLFLWDIQLAVPAGSTVVSEVPCCSPEVPTNPTVIFKQKGKHLLVQPLNPLAADIYQELLDRTTGNSGRSFVLGNADYFGLSELSGPMWIHGKIRLWELAGSDLTEQPLARILTAMGVEVRVDPQLSNYLRKLSRKLAIAQAPFPFPPSSNEDVSLFDRVREGTILRCTKDFFSEDKKLFEAGNRYMVMEIQGEGKDIVCLCTQYVIKGRTLSLANGRFDWNAFMEPMDDYFDDSEYVDIGRSIEELYPERARAMRAKLEKLPIYSKLYEHVRYDAANMALKDGSICSYPMRMAKSSLAVSIAYLRDKKKVGIFGPRNPRLSFIKEMKRMGLVEGVDYIKVDSIYDLEKPARFYLLSLSKVRRIEDPTEKPRNKKQNYLKPPVTTIRRTATQNDPVMSQSEGYVTETVYLNNPCPHCHVPMERFKVVTDPDLGGKKVYWTTRRGYICRNRECSWRSIAHKRRGSAWSHRHNVVHQGGYVDYGLAAHVSCSQEHIKGRMCTRCNETDGTWNPGIYKRLKKKFTMVVGDEIHNAKDITTSTARGLYITDASLRLGLTGTLISNGPQDAFWPLWWALKGPNQVFPYGYRLGYKEFRNRFCETVSMIKTIGTKVDPETGEEVDVTKSIRRPIPFLKNPPDFWRFTAPLVMRRTRQDEMYQRALHIAGMYDPTVDVRRVPCPMSIEQAKLALNVLRDFKGLYAQMVMDAAKKEHELSKVQILGEMTTLKIVATCPEMLNLKFDHEVYDGAPGGGKMSVIKSIVANKLREDSKVVILSDYRAMQQSIYDELRKDHSVLKFQSSWDDDRREEAFESFQSGEFPIFVAGTRSITEGTDMSAADTCICADMLWAPGFQSQAWHRILAATSRERACEVLLLTSTYSLDDYIFSVFYSKYIASEQAQDRKIMSRRSQDFDVKWFADRVLEQEEELVSYLREV